MISNKQRFHGHGSLKYLHSRGRSVRNRLLQLRYVSNKRYPEGRATVIVGKKVVKSAVVRNRIRRRIYEVLRRHWGKISPETDLAITAFSIDIATMPAREVELAVLNVLQAAKLYHLK